MGHSGIDRFFGLPKAGLVLMLAAALTATVASDLGAQAGARAPGPTAGAASPAARPEPLPTTTATTPTPSTTASPPTTATTPTTVPAAAVTTAPPPPPRRAAATKPVPRPAPKPVPRPVPKPPAVATIARTTGSVPFGVYVGAADPGGVASFAAATGTHPVYASDYLPDNGGWAGMSDASDLSWMFGGWKGSGYTLVLGVPMIPTDSSGNAVGTLAGGAAGQYDATFVTLADTLVADGDADAVLRIGWEFNGDWYPWSVTDAADAANFVAYFRNIVDAMRSVPGEAFRFVWNPNSGSSFGDAYTPAQTYPGSAYVDYIGTDLYDECWSTPSTPQCSWTNIVDESWGLDWLAGFAAAQGRPMVFPEWGLMAGGGSHGLGDDPYFIDQFGAWIAGHDVAWTSYFNFDASDGDSDMLDGSFPASLAAFRSVFG